MLCRVGLSLRGGGSNITHTPFSLPIPNILCQTFHMKLILAPILLLTLLFPSLAYGVTEDDLIKRDGIYYKKFTEVRFTGKVTGKTQGRFRNGIKHGPWVNYYGNGQLGSKGTYKDGKEDGPWFRYWNNGQLWTKGTYKDGKREGPWVSYNVKGQLQKKITYKDDNWDGPWVNYYGNGQLDSKRTYKDGKKDGPWVFYHENGQLSFKETWKDDEAVDGPWVSCLTSAPMEQTSGIS